MTSAASKADLAGCLAAETPDELIDEGIACGCPRGSALPAPPGGRACEAAHTRPHRSLGLGARGRHRGAAPPGGPRAAAPAGLCAVSKVKSGPQVS